jgi:hypothetical protein
MRESQKSPIRGSLVARSRDGSVTDSGTAKQVPVPFPRDVMQANTHGRTGGENLAEEAADLVRIAPTTVEYSPRGAFTKILRQLHEGVPRSSAQRF